MTISIAHIDKGRKTIGFASDADAVDQQLVELRNSDNDPIVMDAAKEQLNMPSPGVADTTLRYIDRRNGMLMGAPPRSGTPEDLLHEGTHRYKPVMMYRYDSLYE